MPFAAYLQLFLPRQGGGEFASTPLEIEVSMGDQALTDGSGSGFSLRFRRVIVALELKACQVARTDRYERTLPAEDFSQFLKRVIESSRLGKADLKGGISAAFSNILSAIGIDISAHGEIARSLQTGDTKTVESKLKFKMVRCLPGERWEIGHEILGDPLELDGLLRGRYLNNPPDDCHDSFSPLCFLESLGRQSYSCIIELRAKKTDCVFSPIDNENNEVEWEKRNRELIQKLLALKMLAEQNRSDGLTPPEGEIVLARARLLVSRGRVRENLA
jgi:hypothetical protein